MRRGQALTEFALAVPVFFVLVLLTFEAGRLIFTWSCLLEGTRDAARTAVLASSTSTTPIVAAALDVTSWTGVTASNVTVLRNGTPVSGSFSKQRGDAMAVLLSYTYRFYIVQALGPGWPGLPLTPLPITVQTRMRAEG